MRSAMPAPTKSQLEPIVKGLMAANGLNGENAPDLAGAISEVVAQGLTLFMSQAKVAPGIASPPGATAAPGKLM
ncbi:MAG: hypothetical protein OEV42_04595 [Deltaproteobacteria bacterium]|nr:hypothetical protein [Deltaproteobacteria bacterium]